MKKFMAIAAIALLFAACGEKDDDDDDKSSKKSKGEASTVGTLDVTRPSAIPGMGAPDGPIPGNWKMVTTASVMGQSNTSTVNQCITKQEPFADISGSTMPAGTTCSKRDIRNLGPGSWTADIDCTANGVSVQMKLTANGDFTRQFNMTMDMITGGMSMHTETVGTRLGECS